VLNAVRNGETPDAKVTLAFSRKTSGVKRSVMDKKNQKVQRSLEYNFSYSFTVIPSRLNKSR
jgi:hypothetical protein